MSLYAFLFSRERFVMVNHFSFPFKEEANPEEMLPGRTRATISFLIPVTFLLDAIRLEIADKSGRSLLGSQVLWYGKLEEYVSNNMGVSGHQCLLRFMCELQQHPVEEWSLLGQVLSILFRPRYGNSSELFEYATSEKLGQIIGDGECGTHYTLCPFSVFNYMEHFANVTAPDERSEFRRSLMDPHLHTASLNMIQ